MSSEFNDLIMKPVRKYKMIKDFNPKKVSILLPPSVKINHCGRDKQTIDKSLNEKINCFTSTVRCVLDDDDVDILNMNMKNIQIIVYKDYLSYSYLNNRESYGTYDPRLNLISLVKESKPITLFHELTHAASSIYHKRRCYSGFYQGNLMKRTWIGRGLNEGYTILFIERYFSHISNGFKSTAIEKYIATYLEEIIGVRQMLKLYVRANLYGFVSELKKYDSYDNIIKFLNSIDFIHKYSHYNFSSNDKYIIDSFKTIFSSLLKWNTIKNNNDYNNGLITEEQLFENINSYCKNIQTGYIDGDKQFEFLSFEEAKNIIEDIIINSRQKVKKR